IPVYNSRYVLMVLPAIALLMGVGIHQLPARAHLPMLGMIAAVGIFTHQAGFLPLRTPHQEMFDTILERYQPGDLIWYNPPIGAMGSLLYDAEPEYYLEYVFPQLRHEMFVWDADTQLTDTDTIRRVWDVRPYWVTVPDEAVGPLTNGRVLSEQYDIDAYAVRLYEAPPLDQTPIQFGDLFEMIPGGTNGTTYRIGDTVTVKMWWRALQPQTRDYSYSLRLEGLERFYGYDRFLIDTGLEAGGRPTSQWLPTDEYALTTAEFTVDPFTRPGEYDLRVLAYYWEEPTPLPTQDADTNDMGTLVARITIER
ncbi:MAG: hypothetical protein H7175_07445, partial [Burkholderiales bacterium]|nr:hypothetical protein [Anaerolineae bacterium]